MRNTVLQSVIKFIIVHSKDKYKNNTLDVRGSLKMIEIVFFLDVSVAKKWMYYRNTFTLQLQLYFLYQVPMF